MRPRPNRTRAGALVALITAALSIGLTQAAPSAGAAAATTVTSKPAQSTAYVANSMRGEYRWSGFDAPDGRPTKDLYYRDQVPWSQIEGQQGQFDYSSLDAGLSDARATGGRFGFRVAAWCPGCWHNDYKPYSANDWVPTWLPTQSGTNIPDWNSPDFLSAWEDLWAHLGARYRDDPALGWIDVGGYGAYGEWHRANIESDQITVENAKRLTAAVLDNFPKTHVVVNAMDPTLTNAVLAMSPRLGLRADCLGAPNMYSIIPTAKAGSLIAERWKTAPVLSEWCHADVTVANGAKQVTASHVSMVSSGNVYPAYAAMGSADQASFRLASQRAGYRYGVTAVNRPKAVTHGRAFTFKIALANTGSAPTYDPWTATLQLVNTKTGATTEQDLRIDLRTLLSGTKSYTRAVTAPAGAGTYAMRLVVRDPSGYLAPMALANTVQPQPGVYSLGSLTTK